MNMSTGRENLLGSPCDPTGNRRLHGSGPSSVKYATGHVAVDVQAAHAKLDTGIIPKIQQRKSIDLATWNVQGLLQTGKSFVLERELKQRREKL